MSGREPGDDGYDIEERKRQEVAKLKGMAEAPPFPYTGPGFGDPGQPQQQRPTQQQRQVTAAKSQPPQRTQRFEQTPAQMAIAPLGTPDAAKGFLEKALPSLTRAIGDSIGAERFTMAAMTALVTNPRLLQCTRESLFLGMMQAAVLKLTIGSPTQEAHLVPYSSKGKMTAQMQIGWPGWIKLAYQGGALQGFDADLVCPGDEFEIVKGTGATLRHVPSRTRDPKTWTHAYAICQTLGSMPRIVVMTKDQVLGHRNRSKGWQNAVKEGKTANSPWTTDEPEMAMKTIVIKGLKLVPKAADTVKAVAAAAKASATATPAPTAALLGAFDVSAPESSDEDVFAGIDDPEPAE